MSGPRTTREALIAELLGDLDVLLARVENLPTLVTHAEDELARTAAALQDAGDKYRLAVTAFTEQAKADLSEYYDLKTAETARWLNKTAEEQGAILQEVARQAFRSEAAARSGASKVHSAMRTRLLEHALTATTTSLITAGLVYLIMI